MPRFYDVFATAPTIAQSLRRRVHVAHLAGCDACRVGRKRLGSIAPKHPIRPRWLG